jgi:acyl carrier protein
MQDIESDVKKVISYQLNVSIGKIERLSKLKDDLGADSLDAVSILISLEDKFDILISDQDAKSAKTVGHVISLIEKNLADKVKSSV